MKARISALILFLLSLMLVKSSDHNQALDNQKIQVLIEKNPANYFLYQPEAILFSRFSSASLNALSDMHVVAAQYERALRLLEDTNSDSAERNINSVFEHWPKKLQTQWINHLISLEQFELLQRLADRWPLSTEHLTILKIAQRQRVTHIPDVLHGRLSLIAESVEHVNCKKTVQVVVESYEGLLKAEHLIKRFLKNPEPFDGAFCFSTPLYSNQHMQCDETEDGFAQCIWESQLTTLLHSSSVDYVMVMTNTGLANVVGNVMTLNYQSNYNVLVHELMHFSGFEDEYAFSPKKAHHRCKQKGYIAPNLYVGERSDAPHGWVKNESCQFGRFASFRPVDEWTTLEYHAIPLNSLYRSKWAMLLHDQEMQSHVDSKVNGADEKKEL